MKRATLYAVAVDVVCPDCGTPQPSPSNGSFAWLPEETSGATQCINNGCAAMLSLDAKTAKVDRF